VNLNDEYFTLQNAGDAPVDISGWSIENERGLTYWIPAGTVLNAGSTLYIHTGHGVDSPGILYWGSDAPVWNDVSDIAVLRDAHGTIVDVYPYHSC